MAGSARLTVASEGAAFLDGARADGRPPARRDRLGATAAAAAVIGSAAAFFSVPVADNDLWGHVFFGREMLAARALPLVNTYAYTAPDHPWINHEVLSEIALAWTFDRSGAAGLIALKTLLGLVTLGVIARTCRRRTSDPLAIAAAAILAASLMSYGYLFRPQIFTFLALALLCDRLHALDLGARPATAWLLPLLFAAWVNFHGGVLAGVAVLGAFAAFRWRAPGRVAILGAAVVSVTALAVNPYGLALPAFLVRDVLRERAISEWQSVTLIDLTNLQFKIAVALALLGVALAARRRGWEVTVVLLAALATFRHERHLPLFAVISAPWIAETLGVLLARLGDRARMLEAGGGARTAIAAALVALALLQGAAGLRVQRSLGGGILVPPEQFPVEAIAFLRRAGAAGNLAVPFGWGEYAIYHLAPAVHVSIDGRYTTAYPDSVIDASWRYMDGGAGWERTLETATLALADRRHATASRLTAASGWTAVHADPTAIVFARDGTHLRDPSPEPVPSRSLFP
jgi:hypothetical protein